ncbi:MAG: 6-phosphogluconolactonase [Chloroflexi bacterium]|nr:6-phosphogluconolactonase [Chloroflexota bacterium]
MNLHIFPTLQQLGESVAAHVARLSTEAIAARGRFTMALSGGSLPKLLGPALVTQSLDWPAWRVFWADERCLPQTDRESNHFVAQQYLFGHVPIPSTQIYNPDTSLDPAATAAAYQTTLAEIFQIPHPFTSSPRHPVTPPPRFDLILLGLGEDGHTASLFPGHPLLKETERWVAPIFDSPKPPPQRITLTLPVLNNARQVAFITAGAGKAGILPRVFAAGSTLPAHLVQPNDGELHWFVDEAAAGQLKR